MGPIGSHSKSPFEWIPDVLPVRYSARVMPEILKAVIDELLIHKHAGGAAEVQATDGEFLLGIECLQSMFQAFKADRTGDTFGAKHCSTA
jgi:hypothetical protein